MLYGVMGSSNDDIRYMFNKPFDKYDFIVMVICQNTYNTVSK